MSLNLEPLPLFIFVLTLTYKKKKRKKRNAIRKTHPTTRRMFWCWKGGAVARELGADSALSWAHGQPPLLPGPAGLFHPLPALWGKSSILLCDGHGDSPPKRENPVCPCLQTRSRNQPRSARAGGKNTGRLEPLEPREISPLCAAPADTRAGRGPVLAAARTFEPGVKHVSSIYTMEFYVSM